MNRRLQLFETAPVQARTRSNSPSSTFQGSNRKVLQGRCRFCSQQAWEILSSTCTLTVALSLQKTFSNYANLYIGVEINTEDRRGQDLASMLHFRCTVEKCCQIILRVSDDLPLSYRKRADGTVNALQNADTRVLQTGIFEEGKIVENLLFSSLHSAGVFYSRKTPK
eukprot:Gb_37234 [translate_table: standard]